MSAHNTNAGSQEQTTQTPEAGSTEPQTSPRSSEQRLTGGQQLTAISELLANQQQERIEDGNATGSDEGTGTPGEQAGGEAERTEPDTEQAAPASGDESGSGDAVLDVGKVAEQLGVTPEQIYDMEIPTRDGESTTLGKLKDAWQDREKAAAEMQEKADQLKSREGGLVSDIQALAVLDAMQAVPENIRRQAVDHLNTMAEREYSNFLTLYPDLQDDANRIAFDKKVDDWFGEYGLNAGQFPIRTVGMYRLIKDTVEQRDEIKRLKARTPAKAPQSVKRNRAAPSQPKVTVTGTGRQAQIEGIAKLLKG